MTDVSKILLFFMVFSLQNLSSLPIYNFLDKMQHGNCGF